MTQTKRMQPNKAECCGQEDHEKLIQELSLHELVLWNVSKALERSPNIPLKATLKAMQDNLSKKETGNLSSNQGSPEQYLSCAVLAWQQLGHLDADSLCSFIESHRNEIQQNKIRTSERVSEKVLADVLLGSGLKQRPPPRHNIGEVVKLPLATKKFVMRMDQARISPQQSNAMSSKTCHSQDVQFLKELQCICDRSCTACTTRLLQMEEKEKELRNRAEQLAQRETERAELLEKATSGWVDLESKYLSRLNAAKEQAEITLTKMERELEYRKCLKIDSKSLAEQLKEQSLAIEEKQQLLREVERHVCGRACEQSSLIEEVRRGDAVFADQQCQESQLDRDLKFKNQQVQRKLFAAENDLGSARALLVESERAIRAELTALKDQIYAVSQELLDEDGMNEVLKEELEILRSQKEYLVVELDGCKEKCDLKMENDLIKLEKKSKELEELEKKIIECQCKKPEEKLVEVKRTASLAATCYCDEDEPGPSCTCSAMSSTLLSNLLSSLFRGLQSELGDAGIMMPCTLLKCLEDGHNWNNSTPVKSHLKNFFSQLLIGELDIAIAVAIEKYHARWVGSTCADMRINEQEKSIEQRAQHLANKLAEDLFKERTNKLTMPAKEVCDSEQTCECELMGKNTAIYSCTVPDNTNPMNVHRNTDKNKINVKTTVWKQTQQAVLEMKAEIENLKKASLKKQDLRMMEEKIKKVIKGNTPNANLIEENNKPKNELTENDLNAKLRYKTRKEYKPPERLKECKVSELPKKLGQSFAVNVCFCDQPNQQLITAKFNERAKGVNKRKSLPCPIDCGCLNSMPDTESLDRFMENWNKNLQEARFNGGGCRIMRAVNNYNKDITKVAKVIGAVDSKKGSKPNVNKKASKQPALLETEKTQSKSTVLQKERLKSDKQDERHVEAEIDFKDKTINPVLGKEKKNEPKQHDKIIKNISEENENILCKCSCFREKSYSIQQDCKCVLKTDQSVFSMIRDTIVKKLGPIVGIEAHDKNICKCLNENIDKSVKNIMKTVKTEHCKYLDDKPHCKCIECKFKTNSTVGSSMPQDHKSAMRKENRNVKSKNKYSERSDSNLELKKSKDSNFDSKKNKGKKKLAKYKGDTYCDCTSSSDTSGSLVDESLSVEESIGDNENESYLSSSENSKDTYNLHSKTNKNMVKGHHSPSKSKIKYKHLKISKNGTNKNKKSGKRNKKINRNINQQYFNGEDFGPVQSEYIGAINLDKSQDISKESSAFSNTQPKIKVIGECLETSCRCGESDDLPQSNKVSAGDSMYSNENKISAQHTPKSTDISVDADCYCDYKIKLLGVTLTDGHKKEKKLKSRQKNILSKTGEYEQNSNKVKTNTKQLKMFNNPDCICCEEPKEKRAFTDLEENTFSLLEEYMKKRLDEYRTSCKLQCFKPDLEEKIFNKIFKNVKQIVSDSIRPTNCQCSESDTKHEESKNRAYELLQEYVKMKIDRVQCQCDVADFNKDNVLSDIYEKVCNQIEDDFSKLRSLCGCDKIDELSKSETTDTNTKFKMVSAQNSAMKQTENISSQVSNTGSRIKREDCACGPPAKDFKHIKTGNSFICTCTSFECCTTPREQNKYVIQQCAHVFNKIANTLYLDHKSESQLFEVLKLKSDSLTKVDSCKILETETVKPYPYIGYTIDCSNECVSSHTCSCPKCMAKKTKNIIQDLWSISTSLKTPMHKYSYIMSSVPKTEMEDHSFINNRMNVNPDIINICDQQCSMMRCSSSNQMMLKISKDKIRTMTKALDTSSFSEDMLKVGCSSITYRKLFDINFNSCVHRRLRNQSKLQSSNVSPFSQSSCDCRKVPVCHVKMLMENIEHKLVECKCTCDALDASVCPIHSSVAPP